MKWSPSGWRVADSPRMTPYVSDREGLSYVSLPAGESLQVALPNPSAMGQGLYLYRVQIYGGTPEKPIVKLAGRSKLLAQ